jgi:hypothetical protein
MDMDSFADPVAVAGHGCAAVVVDAVVHDRVDVGADALQSTSRWGVHARQLREVHRGRRVYSRNEISGCDLAIPHCDDGLEEWWYSEMS